MTDTVEIVSSTVDPERREEFLRLRPAAIEAARGWLSAIAEVNETTRATLVDAR